MRQSRASESAKHSLTSQGSSETPKRAPRKPPPLPREGAARPRPRLARRPYVPGFPRLFSVRLLREAPTACVANEHAMDAIRVLCDAAAAGNLGEIRRVLDGGADPNDLVPVQAANGEECETTALVGAAASFGQLEAAALLLDRGASPDKPNSIGHTTLMMSVGRCHAAW